MSHAAARPGKTTPGATPRVRQMWYVDDRVVSDIGTDELPEARSLQYSQRSTMTSWVLSSDVQSSVALASVQHHWCIDQPAMTLFGNPQMAQVCRRVTQSAGRVLARL